MTKAIQLILILFLPPISILKAQDTVVYLGKVKTDTICDIKSCIDYSGKIPKICDSSSDIELRIQVAAALSGWRRTVILKYNNKKWNFEAIQSNKSNEWIKWQIKIDVDKTIKELTLCNVFGLPSMRDLDLKEAYFDKKTGIYYSTNQTVDGVAYFIEYKIGSYYGKYSFANPDAYSAYSRMYLEITNYIQIQKIIQNLTE